MWKIMRVSEVLVIYRDGPRILSWGGAGDKREKKIQIRIHIVLINYQQRQIPKNHCFLIY